MQKLLVLLFCLGISLSKAQEVPHTWLLKHGIKKMFTYTIDSLNNHRLSRITTVDQASKTIIEKDPRLSLFNGDTVVQITRYNEWLRPISVDYTSPEIHTLSAYVYPKNDSTEMVVTHLSEIHRGDSLVYSNESKTIYKTIYKKCKQVRYVYLDEKLVHTIVSRTRGNTKTIRHKYHYKEPGLHPVKEIQVASGTNLSSAIWYKSPNRDDCTKMTVYREKIYNKTNAILELSVTSDYCGKNTTRYRFEYFY